MLTDRCDWTETKKVLEDLKEKCICYVCKQVSKSPHEYECSHFFCENCINWSRNACPVCGVPSHAAVIVPDRCISSCIEVLNTFHSLLSSESDPLSEDLHSNEGCRQLTTAVDSVGLPQKTAHLKSSRKSSAVKTYSRKSMQKNNDDQHYSHHKIKDDTCEQRETDDFTVKSKIAAEAVNVQNKRPPKRSVSKGRRSRKASGSNSVTNSDEPLVTQRTSREKSKSRKTAQSPKATSAKDKRNAKGETPLQVACIKSFGQTSRPGVPTTEMLRQHIEAELPRQKYYAPGDAARVKSLLDEGANPNTKDFAGWTPLHEAVQSGNFTIAELLVKSGAAVNATGAGNTTALHEAVESNNIDIVKLLVSQGACVNARNAYGLSPRDVARTDEIKAILNENIRTESVEVEESIARFDASNTVILASGLSDDQEKDLWKFIDAFDFQVVENYCSEVTAILTNTEDGQVCSLTLPVLCGIMQGKWILSFDWVRKCTSENKIVDHKPFEAKGTLAFPNSDAPRKGRLTNIQQVPSIFNGCYIYVMHGGVCTVHGLNMNKKDVTTLIQMGGGTVLYREPNPESIPESECTVPFHAAGDGPLAKCSHYIIYKPGKTEPQLKYNMKHVKTLPVDWLISCIEKFELSLP
ncbi:BRCA1-associated RING domain protein 1-like isoform X1 [Schistocerca nitens]|uniref:BRCA1-associated RING domain protein 1-like isoform X1 n=1 Tax=Schistocerca nitens TaxID=7011 RepID=UPI002117F20B|nr:BRCA1-associated RING domain protein 1-like isoform X1 [Schistocerca nitens]